MSDEYGWYFEKIGRWVGFNDPSMAHFKGHPIKNLAREITQNVIDAGNGETVQVKFKLRKVNADSIPDVTNLQKILGLCSSEAKEESENAEVFFNIAKKELEKSKVSVLEVSDFNTTGMIGPSKNGTPFYAYIKATGQSKKSSSTATGSYGIGKYAPYVVSKVRTIFLSTIYEDKEVEDRVQLTQGKSVLMSHYEEDDLKDGVGFWGKKKNQCPPEEGGSTETPLWLQRSEVEGKVDGPIGTKLSILCFQEYEQWRDLLAVSIAQNFFGTIHDRNLIADIDGKFAIDKDNLSDFFQNENVQQVVEKLSTEARHFKNCGYYHEALKSDSNSVLIEESEMRILGRCQVRILVGEGLPKKVCFLRNGMFITDYLHGLKSFNGFKEFVAVVQCMSEKGNKLLRAMEPPRHNDFEPEGLSTPEEVKKGKKALKDLAKWVRNMLKKHARDPVSDITSIDELKDFLGDEGGDGEGDGSEEINPFGKVIVRAKPIKPKVAKIKVLGEATLLPDNGPGGDGSGDGTGGRAKGGTGDGPSGGGKKTMIPLSNVRAIYNGDGKRTVSFTPKTTGKIAVRLQQVGADIDVDISIVSSNIGALKNGQVELDVEKEKRVSVTVNLKVEFPGALKVVAHEI